MAAQRNSAPCTAIDARREALRNTFALYVLKYSSLNTWFMAEALLQRVTTCDLGKMPQLQVVCAACAAEHRE